jgi:glycerol kinase
MAADGGTAPNSLRIDGGMTANDWLCRFLADILQLPVERPAGVEATALGAALLAGIGSGLWDGPEAVAALHVQADRFEPAMSAGQRDALLTGWQDALSRLLRQS